MRLKSITKNYLITATQVYTNYDGSVWAVCNPIAVRLPENYELNTHKKFFNDKFIPNLIASDQKADSFIMDIDDYINGYWRNQLRDYHQVELHLNLDEKSFGYCYYSKYIKMFNWHTDARYEVNLSTGLMYVKESITDTLMGIILPIKLKGGVANEL